MSSVSGGYTSSAERLWELIPRWYRTRDEDGEGLLRGMVDVLGLGLDEARQDVLRLLDDAFAETCAPELLPLIGELVGVNVDPALPETRRRYQVAYGRHWQRHRGTAAQLEALGWMITGFRTRVLEPSPQQRTTADPPRSAIISGEEAVAHRRSVVLSGEDPFSLRLQLDVAWPVRRAQLELTPVGPDVHAVDPLAPVGLRRADGTPIFLQDDPTGLVGPGNAIDVEPLEADFPRLGRLTPRFMDLGRETPPYVPPRTLAIDPERGRVAGPTAPMPGIQAYRRYRLTFWSPQQGEPIECRPYPLGGGVYAFSEHGESRGLADAMGNRLRIYHEGSCDPKLEPGARERLLVVRESGGWSDASGSCPSPYVLLEPGQPLPMEEDLEREGLPLDTYGLNRLFSIEDRFRWDRFTRVEFVSRFSSEDPPDHTVQVDVERGQLRTGPAHPARELRVRYYRAFEPDATIRKVIDVLRRALPLGRRARFLFRDTAPGRTAWRTP